MARVLTGVQSTGVPHLGNILGAMEPAIKLSNESKDESFLFIADLHSLTVIRDPEILRHNTYAVAAAWIAFGLDIDKSVFYRQSDVTEVCELTWFLSCFAPYPMFANAHSFKSKADKLSDVSVGLFTYPALMAADILCFDSEIVPVGKDQKQHLEMTRDIANSINHKYDAEIFVIPESRIDENVMTVPGTDGQKMSKSYGNTIDIFLPEKKLRKSVMSIVTDSKGLEEPKDPDTCNVFQLFRLVGEEGEVAEMRNKYLAGGYGYGHAKQALFEVLLEKYAPQREIFTELMTNRPDLDHKLQSGAAKARIVASNVLKRVREHVGY